MIQKQLYTVVIGIGFFLKGRGGGSNDLGTYQPSTLGGGDSKAEI